MVDARKTLQLMPANITITAELFLKLPHHYAKHNSNSDCNGVLVTPLPCFVFDDTNVGLSPIAAIAMHIDIILSSGGGFGFLSGVFVFGGGSLMTSGVTFFGVPLAAVVAIKAN